MTALSIRDHQSSCARNQQLVNAKERNTNLLLATLFVTHCLKEKTLENENTCTMLDAQIDLDDDVDVDHIDLSLVDGVGG